MAKKEYIKITPEGLNLLTILNYGSIEEMNGFYGKEVFLTEGFSGNTDYLFQALGNLGAFARKKDLDKDISVIIIGNDIIDNFNNSFIQDIEDKLNQNSSPYRRMKYISENHLIWYLENRIKNTNDDLLDDLIKKYKVSKKQIQQGNLF
ncbi:hypothetical protein D0T49_03915 [Paludibacter sp. 221]|uniref:hypothetical protein n=1 Tax=Paludibacter sp. 221 TaxID=2302939 RepID=UPI0013D4A7B6|nr:hypothetical protein [Paludibacter sp. 221]NDV46187.1 hypothetical protein [Paludibacter sp. 221]